MAHNSSMPAKKPGRVVRVGWLKVKIMKYTCTKLVSLASLETNPPKAGQWVLIDGAIKGQYLGRTKAGVVVVRYQNGKFGSIADTQSNHLLRRFALVNGAK